MGRGRTGRGGARIARLAALALAALAGPSAAVPDQGGYRPPRHTQDPPLIGAASDAEAAALADGGVQIERDRPARDLLAQHRRLDAALAKLEPQRPGQVDAYVVAAALDSDPVFGREAREAGRVLARRYGADGRVVVLAGGDGTGPSAPPMGSPDALAATLARVAELMDPREDALVLYLTTHGAPLGVVYSDGDQGFGVVGPQRLRRVLRELGIANRLVIVSACYAGVFVPALASPTSAVLTAAAADRSSFGCEADNDWTFFGDALVNRALRRPQPLAAAAREAAGVIAGWERRGGLAPSRPQVSIGAGVARWLGPLERRLPPATEPVGRPATAILPAAKRPRARPRAR